MPRDSNHRIYTRKLKRELTLVYRMLDQLFAERELSRRIIQGMANEIEKLTPKQTEETPRVEIIES